MTYVRQSNPSCELARDKAMLILALFMLSMDYNPLVFDLYVDLIGSEMLGIHGKDEVVTVVFPLALEKTK